MSQPPKSSESEPLAYRSGKDDESRPGVTVPARVVAAFCSVVFIVLMVKFWFQIDRGSPSADTFFQPSILLCLAGSILCLLIAAGVIGRHEPRWGDTAAAARPSYRCLGEDSPEADDERDG